MLKGYFQAANYALGNNSAQGSYAHESVRQCVSTHNLNPILTGYGLSAINRDVRKRETLSDKSLLAAGHVSSFHT